MKKLRIGISDCSKYSNYEKWFMEAPGVELIRLGYSFSNLEQASSCHGIVLTGGQDIHPNSYNRPDYLAYCKPGDIDERRDEFEWKLLETVRDRHLPLLGICRGLQIANVFYGGSLVPDIPSFADADHSKFSEGDDRYHEVKVQANSRLHGITKVLSGQINSAHHQGIDQLGSGLVATAFSPDDSFIEGVEHSDPQYPFLLLVQWHPERMKNQQSPFAGAIRDGFLSEVRKLVPENFISL